MSFLVEPLPSHLDDDLALFEGGGAADTPAGLAPAAHAHARPAPLGPLKGLQPPRLHPARARARCAIPEGHTRPARALEDKGGGAGGEVGVAKDVGDARSREPVARLGRLRGGALQSHLDELSSLAHRRR